jgi:hypothetical protein
VIFNNVTVERVHWLRARAQMKRWTEEFTLVQYEMRWTVQYFKHKAQVWLRHAERGSSTVHAGVIAYAYRQAATWRSLATLADDTFIKVRSW